MQRYLQQWRSRRPRIQRCVWHCGTPRTERHTSKCKATMSEGVLSSFHFLQTFCPLPKYGHQISPSRPPSSASCIVHRKRLRAAGRLVINFLTAHCTEDVVYLKKGNAGLANSPRISSAISTDHTGTHRPIKCEPYCYSKSSDGSPIVRIPSLCTSIAEISEGQNPRILTRLTCSNGLTVYITR